MQLTFRGKLPPVKHVAPPDYHLPIVFTQLQPVYSRRRCYCSELRLLCAKMAQPKLPNWTKGPFPLFRPLNWTTSSPSFFAMASRSFVAVSLLSFLFLFSSASGALPSDSDKVSLGLYYESLCPYSANFIINYLVKIFENGLISIVDLNLVPFGNAKIRGNNTIDCQVFLAVSLSFCLASIQAILFFAFNHNEKLPSKCDSNLHTRNLAGFCSWFDSGSNLNSNLADSIPLWNAIEKPTC